MVCAVVLTIKILLNLSSKIYTKNKMLYLRSVDGVLMRVVVRFKGELKSLNPSLSTVIIDVKHDKVRIIDIIKELVNKIDNNLKNSLFVDKSNLKLRKNVIILFKGRSIKDLEEEITEQGEVEISFIPFTGGG